jgi:hypothetical protein
VVCGVDGSAFRCLTLLAALLHLLFDPKSMYGNVFCSFYCHTSRLYKYGSERGIKVCLSGRLVTADDTFRRETMPDG